MTTDAKYRYSVGFMLLNSQKKVFLGKRCWPKDSPYRFQMPQGGIQEGETPEQAMWREMHEEIGLGPETVKIITSTKDWLHYDLPKPMQTSIVGNKQKWFLCMFLGTDKDVVLTNEKKPEFCGFRWAPPKKVPYLAIPFKRHLYKQVLIEFQPILDMLSSEDFTSKQ